VASLKKQLKVQTTTLISSDATRHILESLSQDLPRGGLDLLHLPQEPNPIREKVVKRSRAQAAYNQQCLYRTCAAVTTFKVRDPDPNAVEDGSVLGVRFEVMSKERFMRPYYVMLNRPYENSRFLRVHRHTVPPCIPLPGLAARHLPAPAKSANDERQPTQDLSAFVRALRREIVRYHNRAARIADLRTAAGLEADEGHERDKAREREKEQDRDRDRERDEEDALEENLLVGSRAVASIDKADAQAKHVAIEWKDGRTGRLVMDDDGRITRLLVFGEGGRNREMARRLLGREHEDSVGDVSTRLRHS
jgi:central kinetochore subunit Mal2/MCM21